MIVGSLIYCARLVACVLSSPADVDIGDPDMSLQTCLTRTREHCYYREPTNYYWSSPYVRVHGRTAPTATPGAARGYRRCSTEDSSFLACRPAVWFAQVEAQFCNWGVAQQQHSQHFDYVIAALDPDMATEVRDLNLHPPAEQPYDRLKETLIQRTEASEQRRLQQLLMADELGSWKPSQLLRRMQQLLGNSGPAPDCAFVRQLFLQHFPTSVSMVLASSSSPCLPPVGQDGR